MSKTEEKKRLQPDCKLSKQTIFSYGLGHMLNDLTSSMWFSYLLIFFQSVLGFASSTSGLPLLIGQVADGLATPLIGLLSDKGAGHRLCRYGHRKSWHLIGTLFVAFSFPFIFSPCFIYFERINVAGTIFYYSIFIIIFQIGWASVQVSHLALAPDLTTNQDERTSLLTVRYTFTVISNIIVHLFTWSMFAKIDRGHSNVIGSGDMNKFQIVSLFSVGLGCLVSLIFHLGVQERATAEQCDADNAKLETEHVKRSTILTHLGLYRIMGVYMMSQLFVNQSQVLIPLYLQDYLHLEAHRLPVLPLVMFISSSMTSLITKLLNTFYGRKTAYVIGSTLAVLACTMVAFGEGNNYRMWMIYGVTAVFGCASSILSVTSLGITADLIGRHTKQGAFVYGLMSFADKISNGVCVMIVQSLKNHYSSNYYRNMLIIMCGGSVAIGVILVLRLPQDFRFIKKDVENTTTNTKIVYYYENDIEKTES